MNRFCLCGVWVAGIQFAALDLRAAPLTWFPGPALNEARSSVATAVAPNGGITIFGGYPTGSINVLVYGGNNVQPLPSPRLAPGALAVNNSLFFVFGGKQDSGTVTRGVLSYNPVSSGTDDPIIFPVASMSTARYDMAYAPDAVGRGYAIGGLGNNNAVLSSVERYDPVANFWTNVASLPAGRYHFAAVFDGTNTIYTFGGRTNGGAGGETATVLGYDVNSNTWSAAASLPVATAGSVAIKGSDGKIYVIGGTSGDVVTNLVQVFDPGANTWAPSTPLPTGLSAAGGATDAQGRLVVFGGVDGNNVDQDACWVSQRLNQPDAAPIFPASAPPTANYLIPYAYTNNASGNPQPTYQLISGPAGMTVDMYSGVLNWIPQADQMGSNGVTIQASNLVGSTNRTFIINAVGPVPDPPGNLVVTDAGENYVTLSWDPVTPVVGSVTYSVHLRHVLHDPRGSGSTIWYTQIGDTVTQPTITITGLAAGLTQTYYIVATAAGSTSGYATIAATTLKPQPPTNLHVTGLTSTSITLEWDASPGPVPIIRYEIWGWINNGTTSTSYGSNFTNTSATLTGLAPGSLHEWGVRGYDAAGNVSGFDYGPTVLNPVPAPALLTGASPATDGSGFQFTVHANAVQTLLIQTTTNPADATSWTTIGTILPATSVFTFTDTNSSQFDMRFYRIASP